MVIAVLEAIGTPIFGLVDENNNVILSGRLDDGTYNFAYEMANGSTVPVGELVLDTAVYYSVTSDLTNCTNGNTATKVVEGKSYSAEIIVPDGYALSSIEVKMGGVDITASSVSGNTISITNVTGDIVITAVATETVVKPAYTNQIPISINTDKTPYVGTNGEQGYKTGYRLSLSSGTEKAEASAKVTGFIEVNSTESVLRVKNIAVDSTVMGVVGYDSTFTPVAANAPSLKDVFINNGVDEGNGVYRSGILYIFPHFNHDTLKYIRLCSTTMDATSIITVDEPIV